MCLMKIDDYERLRSRQQATESGGKWSTIS